MRLFLVLITLSCSLLLQAQSFRGSNRDSSYFPHLQAKKWFVTSYSNVGIGYTIARGGSATIISAPVGLQLNRKLNENLYAFTGVSLAPTYMSLSQPFLSPGLKSNTMNGLKPNYFGLNPSVNMGLMYVNDARTFSVSGSISVQRSNYPMPLYSPAYMQPANNFTPVPVYR